VLHVYNKPPTIELSTIANMNIDQREPVAASRTSYVEGLGELLRINIDLTGETTYDDDDGDYLDDMDDSTATASDDVESAAVVEPDIDSEFLETKLRGYELVTNLTHLCVGDHVRITQNRYQQEGRRCSYLVLKRYDTAVGAWWVNGFRSEFPDWKISVRPLNRYKAVRFYRKNSVEYTGQCHLCERDVNSPYRLCYTCTETSRSK
jgi:hypothetical protein